MIIGIYEFWFFWSKNGRFVTHMLFFQRKVAETPIFIVFLGCALFGPSCQKRGIWTPNQKKKFSLITEKLIFEYFLFFLFFFFFFFFVFFLFCCIFFVFFGGFKGHVRWPEGPAT